MSTKNLETVTELIYMNTKNLETVTELVVLLNDHVINGERDKAETVAQILNRVNL